MRLIGFLQEMGATGFDIEGREKSEVGRTELDQIL